MVAQIPGDDVKIGGDVDRIVVSVRVTSDHLDPQEVTRALGVAPTFASRKGELSKIAGRDVLQGTGTWFFEFAGAPEEWTLDDAIETLLRRLPADLTVWEQLSAKYRLDVFCGVYLTGVNRGMTLSQTLLRQLADRHLELDLDIYCVDPDAASR